ncbi:MULTISPECIES: urease accessory protein UreD [Falsihalocynthiibacter]|uniref:urease accessory protein UreD n=1 Tax=Falsihalocynthiibacter TaxID=2854182 RepID=UPI003002E151
MLDLEAQIESGSECTASPRLQRMFGRGFASVHAVSGRIRLKDLHQSGSAKVFLPKIHAPTPEIVFLNTSGGVTGGDHISYGLDVGAGARVNATTQTAERAYQSVSGTGRVDVNLTVGDGARLDWLPQETILFEGSNMARKTLVDLASDAEFLMVETVILGRAAMGETLVNATFSDWREVRVNGRPEWIEPFALDKRNFTHPKRAATLSGARALATIALFAPQAQDALGPVRSILSTFSDVTAAASGWNGRLIIRLFADDGWPLQRVVAKVLNELRVDPLPRVWQK